MKHKKAIKWALIILVTLLLLIFFLFPMGLQDRTSSSYTVDVNNNPELVFNALNDMENVEKWLINKETPNSYTVTYSQKTNTSPFFIRTNPNRIGEVQKVTRTVSAHEDYDDRIMRLSYDIQHDNHNYKRRLYLTIAPNGNLIASTGQSVNTARLYVDYEIDFRESDFFEKLFGKWKIILVGQDHTDEDLIKMSKNLKLYIEDNFGRMLDDR